MQKVGKKQKIVLGIYLAILILVAGFVFVYKKGFIFKAEVPPASRFSWQDSGIGNGGKMPRVVIDQSSSNIVYAGGDISGLSKSVDGGDNWTQINTGLEDSGISGIAIDHSDHNILYVSTERGVYKSINQGLNWTKKSAEILGMKIHDRFTGNNQIAQSRTNPNILYVISLTSDYAYSDVNKRDYSIYKSTNRGENWTKLDGSAVIFSGKIPFALEIDPKSDNIVYVGSDRGLFKTIDGGNTWQENTGLNSAIHTLLGYDANNALTDSSVLKNICDVDVNNHQFPGKTEDGVRSCRDFDLTSTQTKSCKNQCLVDYENGPKDYTKTPDGYQYSGAKDIRSIIINPYNSKQIFVLSSWGHIYRSQDSGVSWQEIYHRDNPILESDPGHLTADPKYKINNTDFDWRSFDSTSYNDKSRLYLMYTSLKLDINSDPVNINKCSQDSTLSQCEYYLYASSRSGWSLNNAVLRVNSSNIKENGWTKVNQALPDGPEPNWLDPNVNRYNDREAWEPVFKNDPIPVTAGLNYWTSSAGNLTKDYNWAFAKFWRNGVGNGAQVIMMDLDLSTAYPNRTLYFAGSGIIKGTQSSAWQNPQIGYGQVGGYKFNLDFQWKYKGLENTVLNSVTYDPLNPKIIYAAVSDVGFVRSLDGGKTFQRNVTTTGPRAFKFQSACEYNNTTGTLDQNACLLSSNAYNVVAAIVNNQTVVYSSYTLSNGGTIFKSTNNGDSWQNTSGNNSLPADGTLPKNLPPDLLYIKYPYVAASGGGKIQDIIINKQNPNQIFVSIWNLFQTKNSCVQSYDSCVYDSECNKNYSPEELERWKQATCNTSEKSSLFWPTADSSKQINITPPVYYSNDGGQTWQSVNEGLSNGLPVSSWGSIDYDSQNGLLYYGVNYGQFSARVDVYGKLYKSADLGQTWTEIPIKYKDNPADPITVAYGGIYDVKVDPFHPQNVYVLAKRAGVQPTNYPYDLLKTSDNGNTWSKVTFFESYPSGDGKIIFDPYRPNRIALSVFQQGSKKTGVMISEDGGQSWNVGTNNIVSYTNNVAFHPSDKDKIVLATGGNGLAWSYNPSLPAPAVETSPEITPTPSPSASSTPAPAPTTPPVVSSPTASPTPTSIPTPTPSPKISPTVSPTATVTITPTSGGTSIRGITSVIKQNLIKINQKFVKVSKKLQKDQKEKLKQTSKKVINRVKNILKL